VFAMSTAHPALPTYQFGSFLRRQSPPDDLRIQSLGRPKSAMVGGVPSRSPFQFHFPGGDNSLELTRADGKPCTPRRVQPAPLRPQSAALPIRQVALPGPTRTSEIAVRTIHTWIPRTMPPVQDRSRGHTPTPILRGLSPITYAYPAVQRVYS